MSDYPERIEPTADYIDSRDVRARIEYLSVIRQAGPVPEGLLSPEDAETDQDSLFAELAALEELDREGANNFADWEYGETLIHEASFVAYAQELAEDIGAINRDAAWPLSYIDWEAAANALLIDYSDVQYLGQTYYGRA